MGEVSYKGHRCPAEITAHFCWAATALSAVDFTAAVTAEGIANSAAPA